MNPLFPTHCKAVLSSKYNNYHHNYGQSHEHTLRPLTTVFMSTHTYEGSCPSIIMHSRATKYSSYALSLCIPLHVGKLSEVYVYYFQMMALN